MIAHEPADTALRVLHVEDSSLDVELIRDRLQSSGYALRTDVVSDEAQFVSCLQKGDYDVILADYNLPSFDALRALSLATSLAPELPFIAVSGAIGEERAVELLKEGATDYVLKDRLEKLPLAIQRALDEVGQRQARQKAEEALRRLNRELRAITKCTETLMRACDEQVLIADICRIVCEDAGYLMAWVGFVEHDEARGIRAAAWSGLEAGYFDETELTWADGGPGDRPSGAAVRTGAASWIQDLAEDDKAEVWRDAALQRGFRAALALPLKDDRRTTFGVLGIYAGEPCSFTADEVRILEELAENLAFGIMVLRARDERRRAEQALGESEAKLHGILDGIGIGVCLVSPGLRVLEMNAQMRRWYPGVAAADQPLCYEAFGERSCQHPCRECPAALTFRDGLVHESTMQRIQRERPRNFRVVTSPVFDTSGVVVAAIEMVEDITDRMLMEATLQHAQKMDAVGRLAGGVAHDFNNALNVILGNSELALGEVQEGSELCEYLDEIKDAAERSANLTRQLLAFARKQTVLPTMLDLNLSVENMLKMLRRLIGEGIELVWKPGSDLGLVKLDPSHLDQILANLCVNARDAMAGAGRVTIETSRVIIDRATGPAHAGVVPGDYVQLIVGDEGKGMDQGTLARVFEPFFTTKSVGMGTGLGLSTVYGIVTQSSGFVRVTSTIGRGTTFRVYLPRHGVSAEIPRTTGSPATPAGGWETVLIVEDDVANLSTTRRLLTQLGYKVLTASAPSEAIRTCEAFAGEIHLLFTDVVMPELSGPELAARLVALRPGLRCLFMSGYAGQVAVGRSIAELRPGFIHKPFSMVDLANKIREALHDVDPEPVS